MLSGAVTETPVVEPTAIDMPCPYCGGVVEVSYRDERLLHRCRECPGAVGGGELPAGTFELGYLPPAGLQGRTPREMVVASTTWAVTERVAMSNDVCPRCAGVVDHTVEVCETNPSDGICDDCHRRHAVYVESQCQICPHEKGGVFLRRLMANPEFRAFFEQRGLDLFSLSLDEWDALGDYNETILSVNPFAARFTFTTDGDRLTGEVDDSLTVVDLSIETA